MSEASWCYRNQVWSLSLSTGEHWTGDKIWIATGCKLDVKQDPLLSEVMKEFPIQVCYVEKCVVFVHVQHRSVLYMHKNFGNYLDDEELFYVFM